MINDLFHWLLATFVLTPFEAEIDRKLQAANASRAIFDQVQTCMADAPPRLLEKANGDWFWTTTTVISVASGLTQPEQVLGEQVPACRPAIDAVRPLRQERTS
jgi:hypothetical protein